jgi:hypothetical protein
MKKKLTISPKFRASYEAAAEQARKAFAGEAELPECPTINLLASGFVFGEDGPRSVTSVIEAEDEDETPEPPPFDEVLVFVYGEFENAVGDPNQARKLWAEAMDQVERGNFGPIIEPA